MSSQPRRLITTLALTGQTQSVAMPLTIGKVNQIIVTSDTADQTVTMELLNEKSDSIWGPTDIQPPKNDIRPELIPIGQMTIRITNPVPPSGTLTFVSLVEEK